MRSRCRRFFARRLGGKVKVIRIGKIRSILSGNIPEENRELARLGGNA